MANFPVFNPDPRWFPMPTLQQGSPFGGVLSDAIAKRLAMAKAQTAEAEVPYAGLSSLAGAMSKGAYAVGMPMQSLVTAMTHSPQWSNMTEPQRQGAINAVYNTATQQSGLSPIFGALMQKELEKLNAPQSKSTLLDSLKSAFGIGSYQQQNDPVQQPAINPNISNMTQPLPGTTAPIVPAERGDQPQSFINEQNYKKGASEATAEGSAVGDQSAKQLEKVQAISAGALQMDQLIDSAVNKYKESWLKGPVLGNFAQYGNDSAQALKDTNTMAIAMADQLFGAGSTDAKQAAATTLKLNMKDPARAFDEFATKMKAQNDRFKYQGTFYQTAKQLGITNPAERDQLWFDYNAQHPPYDYKNHKPIKENLGLDQNEIQKFITQQRAINNTFGKKIENTLKQNTAKEEEEFVNNTPASKNKGNYAKTIEEFESGKAAEESRMKNGVRQLKIGGKWYEEY